MSEIQTLVDRIACEFHPQKIILFGSHAAGDAGPYSDVDLLVIIDSAEHPARTAARITERVHPRRYSVDLIVRSPETIRTRLKMNDCFMREVIGKGRVVYAA
ncbi:MAG: nucleotidyltransferase domain-containing protein [Verrucomicrobia bacterium]|nr:nucleotidyltransferase domain-containing protein [Verrucomicrobiota bacterium]